MDLVTHGLLGATVAQVGFSQKFSKKAAFYGFVLGLFPDIDVLSSLLGPWISIKFHRGPLHSVFVLALLTFPIAWFAKKISNSDEKIFSWIQLTFWCLLSHTIIDWFTSYGTLLFWPITSKRFALDSLPIIDPFFSFPLLLSTFYGFLTYANPIKKKHLAIVAILLSFGYNFFGYLNSRTCIKFAENQLCSEGSKYLEIRATPTLLNTLLYRIIIKKQNHRYKIAYLNVLNKPNRLLWTDFDSDNNQLTKEAYESEKGKLFSWFSMGFCAAKIENQNEKIAVKMNDLRYGSIINPINTIFSVQANFSEDLKLISFERKRSAHRMSIMKEISAMLKTLDGDYQKISINKPSMASKE